MSCHSSGSLEGGCPSSAEVIEDTEDFIQFKGLYSLFTAFERFTYNTCTLQHVYFAHYNVHSTISIEPNTNQLDGLARLIS